MKLLLVNPNTTASMTDKMREAACAVASAGTEIIAVTSEYGPESIEGYYDEVFSIPAMLDAVKAHPDASGVVVGCFDDTGVDAARCVTSAPVIGICQAAMQVASVVSGSFTVVTTLGRSVPVLEHLVRRYGYADLCRRVRASDIPVLALEDPASGARDRLRCEMRRALDEDGCEAIVLGCAGMVDMARFAFRGAGGAGGGGRDRGGEDRRRSRGAGNIDLEAWRLCTAPPEGVHRRVLSIRRRRRDHGDRMLI